MGYQLVLAGPGARRRSDRGHTISRIGDHPVSTGAPGRGLPTTLDNSPTSARISTDRGIQRLHRRTSTTPIA